MAFSSTQERGLTEDDVRTASQQYDAALIYHASLPRQGLRQIEPNAFARCESLQLLDLSGNSLATLAGLAPIAAQLTFLNAAENKLTDITALAACTALQHCHLEGNELASTAALQVLVSLPQLADLMLQRTVLLDGIDRQETLLLDNPVCRNVEAYQQGFLRQVQHVRWVDGVPAFARQKQLASHSSGDEGEASGDTTSNDALLSAAAASHEATLQAMMRDNAEESKLRKLLADVAKKCEKACRV